MVATILARKSKSPSSSKSSGRKPLKPSLSVVSAPYPVKAVPILQPQPPLRVQLLLAIQRGTSILAGISVLLTLTAYGWSVYSPKRWSQEFKKLEVLQSYERQLVAMDETLKHQLAGQAANPSQGLVAPHPNQSLFVVPSKASASPQPKAIEILPETPSPDRSPIAY